MAHLPSMVRLFAALAIVMVSAACASGQATTAPTRANAAGSEPAISLDAPAEVTAGARVEITWTGTTGTGDYIAIVPAGAAAVTDEPYVNVSGGSPATLAAPAEPGAYDIVLVAGDTLDDVRARRPITVR